MAPARVSCTLVLRDGAARRLGLDGIVIGRQPDCDLVSVDPAMSRRHALVRLTTEGVEIVPLGRGTVTVNGTAHDRPCTLASGDEVRLPGLVFGIALDTEDASHEVADTLSLERRHGETFGIRRSPFHIGGASTDDLILSGWPPSAIVLHVDGGQLCVEARVADVHLGAIELAVGQRSPIAPGDEVTHAGETFRLASRASQVAHTTMSSHAEELPSAITLETLPRGGLVVFTMPSSKRSVFFADRRFDLLLTLLRPPRGYSAGDFIGDDVVSSNVWPRTDGVGRTEINVLISRVRRDLVDAGLNGALLVQRAPGGGGTRFVLAPGATIEIKA